MNIQNPLHILIISNACFSQTDSNGRTLAKLFQSFDKSQLAQFFVYGTPDFSVCENYYQVSDRDALNAFIKQKPYGHTVGEISENPHPKTSPTSSKKITKTPLSMLLREIAWKFGKWMTNDLIKWIDDFSPDAVFISLGDNVFLGRLARTIAKLKNIPLYVYSTENYAFKNYNYLTKRPSLFYSIFYKWLNVEYKKLQPYVKCGIFNTPLLTEAYQAKYTYPCKCVFSPSDIDYIENYKIPTNLRVSYLGNMGVNRHIPLVELANMLTETFPDVKLDVYGNLPSDEEVANSIKNCKNIRYCGFVPYDDVVRTIHESTLLVHVEQNDKFYTEDLKYAFSTKIADSVCSGTPFLIYARRDLAGTDFLMRNKCAFIAETKEELRSELTRALSNETARRAVVETAKYTREKYFLQQNLLHEILTENDVWERN